MLKREKFVASPALHYLISYIIEPIWVREDVKEAATEAYDW